MKTMQAYMDVVYYKGTIRMAAEKWRRVTVPYIRLAGKKSWV